MRASSLKMLFVGFLLFLFCMDPAQALDPNKLISQYDIRLYTARDGLPMNSIKKIFQDSHGFIWIGTQEGLVRFDGARFRLYDKSRYSGLRSNFIWDIAEDHSGNLWLATQGGGISRFDGQQCRLDLYRRAGDRALLSGAEQPARCGKWPATKLKLLLHDHRGSGGGHMDRFGQPGPLPLCGGKLHPVY